MNFTKKLSLLGCLLFIFSNAHAASIGGNTVRIGTKTGVDIEIQMGEGRLKWDQATSKIQFSNDSGSSLKDIGSGGGAGSGVNILENPDFETGTPPANWTASGGAFVAVTDGFDTQAGSFDASASSQNLDSDLKAVPLGLENRSCNATIQYKYASGSGGDYKFQVLGNSAGLIAEKDLTVTTDWEKDALQFDCPSSDSIRIRITSTLDGNAILIDNASLGKSDFISISQTTIYGSVVSAGVASCNWSLTANQTFTSFPVDSDCNTATPSGNASAPATKIPAITFDNGLPSGKYRFEMSGYLVSSTAAQNCSYRFSDGTNVSTANTIGTASAMASNTVIGYFDFPNGLSGSKTFEIQATGQTGNATCAVVNDTANVTDFRIDVIRFPQSEAEAITLETTGSIWSGRHDNTCSWARTNTVFGDPPVDASCNLVDRVNKGFGVVTTDGGPNVTFTPKRLGTYFVCVVTQQLSSVAATNGIQLFAGANIIANTSNSVPAANVGSQGVCGPFEVVALSALTLKIQTAVTSGTTTMGASTPGDSGIEWTIFPLTEGKPAPVFLEVKNKMNAGIQDVLTRVCRIEGTGTPAPGGDTTLCGWIDNVVDNGVGNYTLNFTAGTFAAEPVCLAHAGGTSGLLGNYASLIGISSTTFAYIITDEANNNIDIAAFVSCTAKQ